MRPRIHIAVATLLALIAAGLLTVFPHDHVAGAVETASPEQQGHAPHHDSRLEPHGLPAQSSDCAICFFQRVLSHASTADAQTGATVLPFAPLPILSDEIVLADVAFVADPRGPPAA